MFTKKSLRKKPIVVLFVGLLLLLASQVFAKEAYQSVIDQIKAVDILDITPLNAMTILNDLIEAIKDIDKKD